MTPYNAVKSNPTATSGVRFQAAVLLLLLCHYFRGNDAFVVPTGHPSTLTRGVVPPPSASALSIGRLKRFFGGGSGGGGDTAVMEKEGGKATTSGPDASPEGGTSDGKETPGDKEEEVEETNEVKKLFAQIKNAGVAGSISLFLWEGAFWAISIPVAIFGYNRLTGHWPDLSDKEDLSQVGAEAFAFANVARLALPVRIGLAISTTPWVQTNIVDRFMKKEGEKEEEAA